MSLAPRPPPSCTRGMSKSERATQEWTLATVATGATVHVLGIDVEDPTALLVHGIRPGARLAIDGDAPFGGPRIVRIGGCRVAVDRRLARAVRVTPAPRPAGAEPAEPSVSAWQALTGTRSTARTGGGARRGVAGPRHERTAPGRRPRRAPERRQVHLRRRDHGPVRGSRQRARAPRSAACAGEVRVGGRDAVLVDLPGAHSLTDRSDGLPPFWQLLLDARPDAILSIVDAGELALHLPLVLACRDLGLPIVVAANLADEAEAHGIELDLGRLSQLLAAPVHRTVGRRGVGVHAALADAIRLAEDRRDAPDGGTAQTSDPAVPARTSCGRWAGSRRGCARVRPRTTSSRRSGPASRPARFQPIAAATIASAARLEPERWALAADWAGQVVASRRAIAGRAPIGSAGS